MSKLIDFKTRKTIQSVNVSDDQIIERFKQEVDGLLEKYKFGNCGLFLVFLQEKNGELFPDVLFDARYIDRDTLSGVVVACAEAIME